MENLVWSNVNASAIDALIHGSGNLGNPNSSSTATDSNKETIAKIESIKQYPYEDEIVSQTTYWDTGKLAHILYEIFAQIFADVDSADVTYDQSTGKVIGTLYFKYNGVKKNPEDYLAFALINQQINANNDLGQQIMIMNTLNNRGNVVLTKEAQEIFADLVHPITQIDRGNPNWINKIDWPKYSYLVRAANEYGCNICLTGLNVAKIINIIINHKTSREVDANGNTKETTRKLDIVVTPGTIKAGTDERQYEIVIFDHERAMAVANAATGTGYQFGTGNLYRSYR